MNNKVFLFALFYRQFRNAYLPVARTGTGMQKRSELPLPLSFSEMFRKLSTYSTKRLSDKTFKMYPNISFQKKKYFEAKYVRNYNNLNSEVILDRR